MHKKQCNNWIGVGRRPDRLWEGSVGNLDRYRDHIFQYTQNLSIFYTPVFPVTITADDSQAGTTFKGFLIEVFTDAGRFMGGEFTAPENAHQACDGVSLLCFYSEDST
jgi:hypothetical protein